MVCGAVATMDVSYFSDTECFLNAAHWPVRSWCLGSFALDASRLQFSTYGNTSVLHQQSRKVKFVLKKFTVKRREGGGLADVEAGQNR